MIVASAPLLQDTCTQQVESEHRLQRMGLRLTADMIPEGNRKRKTASRRQAVRRSQ
jgi:hypothetical protein